MKKRTVLTFTFLLMLVTTLAFSTQQGFSYPSNPPGVEKLRQDSGNGADITWNPQTDTPSFIQVSIPLSTLGLNNRASPTMVAITFADHYKSLFGINQASIELDVVQVETDVLGMQHVTLNQYYQGVKVYSATMKVHLSLDGRVVAVSSGFVPDIQLSDTQPRIDTEQAMEVAKSALPNGMIISGPELVVYPGRNETSGPTAKLSWLVELRDNSIPARNVYVVDANKGVILDVLNHLYKERDRETYDADHNYSLPGTLVRSEGDDPTEDQDVDNAHDFAGDTYDYFVNTHNRDSYDDLGATLISTANYGSSYMNAFWNGEQTTYGDGFPVNDVVAHEWTHAVTEHSANLEYRWQSGALNESFSDIFGAMVDRDDWFMGEDLPPHILGGREAIRDLSDPPRFGQPEHTDDWVETCSDNEGVHTNSGIPNKAFYNIATAIGKDKAERIFYRILTIYLTISSSLEDTRAAALQSTEDLYGAGSVEYTSVRDGFNAVGLDGMWNPPSNDCTCAVTIALSDETVYTDQVSVLDVASTLYRTRDQLLNTTSAGGHYLKLYEQHTSRISYLLLLNSQMRDKSAKILKLVTPGMNHLMDEEGDQDIITQEMVTEIIYFLQGLAEEDRAKGGNELAETIEREITRLDWDHLVGLTFEEAWDYIQSRNVVYPFSIYMPIVSR